MKTNQIKRLVIWLYLSFTMLLPSLVFGSSTNIALNKTVAASTNSQLGIPSNIVDGTEETYWYSYQGNPTVQDFILDLGAVYTIDRVDMYVLQVYGVAVSTSTDGINYTERFTRDGESYGGLLSFSPNGIYQARYIKYHAYANWPQYVGVSEIEVWSDSQTDNTEGISPPNGDSVVDATPNPSSAPVYMGNITAAGGGLPELRGKMELSVDFPAYNKPVDIWILIGLPDGRFYVADEGGRLLNLDTSGFLAIVSGVSGIKTEKTILTPFEVPSSDSSAVSTPFDPFPENGVWTVYWLISPASNGDIIKALENGDYELGFYIFQVNKSTIPDDPNEPEMIVIPDVVGKTQSDAISAITSAELHQGTITQQFSSSVPAGTVISQNPSPGQNATAGSKVNLVVSKGAEPVSDGFEPVDSDSDTTISSDEGISFIFPPSQDVALDMKCNLETTTNNLNLQNLDMAIGSLLINASFNFTPNTDEDAGVGSFIPQIVIPKEWIGSIDVNTINLIRVGDNFENGTVKSGDIQFLPVSVDGDGNIVAYDIFMPDSLLSSIVSYNKRSSQRADTLSSNNASLTISYVVGSFQDSANWRRDAKLIRMLPYKEGQHKRKTLDSSTKEEIVKENKKPVQNVVVLVHGHNEAEKAGQDVSTDVSAPWLFSYKRDVWTIFYNQFLDSRKENLESTRFYEFVYPSYRPIFTPTTINGAAVETLDNQFAEALKKELALQLENGLKFNLFIVAHSMGGLVSRAGLQKIDQNLSSQFQKLITWGTPHLGGAIVSMRYVLGSPAYQTIVMPQVPTGMTSLKARAAEEAARFIIRKAVTGMTMDTPGTRDLRWTSDRSLSSFELCFDNYFKFNKLYNIASGIDESYYDLNTGGYVYNVNLKHLNDNDKFKNSAEKYIFLYGVTSKTVGIDPSTSFPYFTVTGGDIALGAKATSLIMRYANNNYENYTVGSADGAVPIMSMEGFGVAGESKYLGDIDHEEYFGAPSSPGQFMEVGKAKTTSNETITTLGIGTNKNYDNPELTANLAKLSGGKNTYSNEPITGKLNWPGDNSPENRLKNGTMKIIFTDKNDPNKQLEGELSDLIFSGNGDFEAKVSFSGPEGVYEAQLAAVFKDDTELYSLKAGCRYQEVSGTNGSVMKDSETGLEWQRCSYGQTWNQASKSCDGDAALMNANAAFELTMDGGWRTPTVQELGTLVYCSDDTFPVNKSWFWTSSWWEFCVGEQCDYIPYAMNYEESKMADIKNMLPVRLVKSPY